MSEKFAIVWGQENKRRSVVFKEIREGLKYMSLFPPSGSTNNPYQTQLYELRKKDYSLLTQQVIDDERIAREEKEKQELLRLMQKYPDEVNTNLTQPPSGSGSPPSGSGSPPSGSGSPPSGSGSPPSGSGEQP